MNILNAVSQAGGTLKKVASTKGGEYAGPCPACGGSDRFRCWPAEKGGEGSYWCRGCGKGGDLVQFFVDFLHYDYKDAFRAAGRPTSEKYKNNKNWSDKPSLKKYRPAGSQIVGESASNPGILDVPVATDAFKAGAFIPRTYENPCETWQIKAEKFVNQAHEALFSYPAALKYLAARGLDDRTVRIFKIGWFAGENGKNCAYRPRTSWGLPNIKNEKTGRDKMLWLPRGFVIPWYQSDSHSLSAASNRKIHRIRIRRPKADIKTDRDIKYYVLPGSGMEALNVNLTKKTIVIIESELDGMMVARYAWQKAGVVAMGSAANKPGSSVYYSLKKALCVLVALDYDAAGQKAMKWWQENFPAAKFWPVPEGKDPGEAFQAGIDIKKWIWAGLPAIQCLDIIDSVSGAADENTDTDIVSNSDAAANIKTSYKPPVGLSRFQEIQFLLKSYPVTIYADCDRAEVVCRPDFKNKAVLNRINALFHDDDEIHCYYRFAHPDTIITGKNCAWALQ